MDAIAKGRLRNKIIAEIELKHRVTIYTLKSRNRTKLVCLARDELAYRLRHECGLTDSQTGRAIGRTHTSANNAIMRETRRRGEPWPKTT